MDYILILERISGLDDGEMSWSQPTVSGDVPSKRAAHAGCAVDGTLYLFGGMNETGALDDLYSLNTGTPSSHLSKGNVKHGSIFIYYLFLPLFCVK